MNDINSLINSSQQLTRRPSHVIRADGDNPWDVKTYPDIRLSDMSDWLMKLLTVTPTERIDIQGVVRKEDNKGRKLVSEINIYRGISTGPFSDAIIFNIPPPQDENMMFSVLKRFSYALEGVMVHVALFAVSLAVTQFKYSEAAKELVDNLYPRDLKLIHCNSLQETLKLICTKLKANMMTHDNRLIINPMISQLNHSCTPNCTWNIYEDGQTYIRFTEDIKPGDELTIWYPDEDAYIDDTESRKEHIKNQFGFVCQCKACIAAEIVPVSNNLIELVWQQLRLKDQMVDPSNPPPEETIHQRFEVATGLANSIDLRSYRFCICCGSTEDLRLCGRCKVAYYCSRECQIKGYSTHKTWCRYHPSDPKYTMVPLSIQSKKEDDMFDQDPINLDA